MKDVFGIPQNIMIVGGNSDIATAILKELMSLKRVRKVIILTRDGKWNRREDFASIPEFRDAEISVSTLSGFSASRDLAGTDLDLCIIATGFLPTENIISDAHIEESLNANLVIPTRLATSVALHMKRQGHGLIVGISSIAAVRVRPDNWIYGFAKSAFDQFLRNLMDDLKDTGVSLLILRSGMVRTKMSAHLKEAPLTVDPEVIASVVRDNLKSESSVIWVPRQLQILALILRFLPRQVLKRLKN